MVNFPITVIATDTEPVVRYIRALIGTPAPMPGQETFDFAI